MVCHHCLNSVVAEDTYVNHLVVRAMKLGKDRPLALPALFSLGPLPRGTAASIIVGWDTAASSLWCTFSLGTIGGNMPVFTASVAFHWSSFSAIGRAFFSPPGRGGSVAGRLRILRRIPSWALGNQLLGDLVFRNCSISFPVSGRSGDHPGLLHGGLVLFCRDLGHGRGGQWRPH